MNKVKLPPWVYCPYHGCRVRSCEHLDERLTDNEVVDKILEIHNYFSYPDSQFYKGDKEQYKKFKIKILGVLNRI